MGKLTVEMFMTLDGVVQAPGGPDEDQSSGFEFGGWQAPYDDPNVGQAIVEHLMRLDALLLGRKTYDIFSNYWPKQSGVIADKLNGVPKYVASTTLTQIDWVGTSLLEGDVAAAVRRVKAAHDEVHTIGSANLVQTLLQHELVDELNLWIYPLVLGTGKRLFAEGTVPSALRLAYTSTFPSEVVQATYAPAGKPTFGTIQA